jgi:TetR/AcrR family transcriptional regulator, transcriptional repressor for nem operon
MTTAPTRKELTHARIVEVAARAIRRAGFQGVGVADIMKEAGLTHGGFYAHFPSRDALLAEALAHAGREGRGRLDAAQSPEQRAPGSSPLRALVESYLSARHMRHPERGCSVAALAGEMPRQAPEVRQAAAERVRSLIARVGQALPEGCPTTAAPLIACQMVGALQLARTLGEEEGLALLAQVRESVLAQYDKPNA